MRPNRRNRAAVCSLLAMALASPPLLAATSQQASEIPTCSRNLGTIAVLEPENNWWGAYQLGSPAALIKVFVSRSHCFTLVDRGKGMAAMQAERALA